MISKSNETHIKISKLLINLIVYQLHKLKSIRDPIKEPPCHILVRLIFQIPSYQIYKCCFQLAEICQTVSPSSPVVN